MPRCPFENHKEACSWWHFDILVIQLHGLVTGSLSLRLIVIYRVNFLLLIHPGKYLGTICNLQGSPGNKFDTGVSFKLV